MNAKPNFSTTCHIFFLAHTKSIVRDLPASPSILETRLTMAARDSSTAVEVVTYAFATVITIDQSIQTTLQSWNVLAQNMVVHYYFLDHQTALWLPRFFIPVTLKNSR